MPTSQNGYPANDVTLTKSYKIPGTSRAVRLRNGPAGELLVALAAWFHREIEPIDRDREPDDWGYAERPIRGSTTTLSNHASGTAIDLNATQHPLGARNTFTDAQERKIRAKLAELNGCVRWGGDYRNRADEMHFEIMRNEAACQVALSNFQQPEPPTPEGDWFDMATKAEVEDAVKAGVLAALREYGASLFKDEAGTADALWDEARAHRAAELAELRQIAANTKATP